MSELLEGAFRALGPGPTRRELELVADVLRESGDREALDMLAGDPEAVAQLADANGSHGLVALDLQVVVGHGIDGLVRKSVYDREAVFHNRV